MNISHHPGVDSLELRLVGRLDATWADHVSDTIEAAIRNGSHRIVLNFAGVSYISSLGIAVLMKHYQRLQGVSGSLRISEPSVSILNVLNAARLAAFLIGESAASRSSVSTPSRAVARLSATYDVYPQRVSVPLTCTAIGDPARLTAQGFGTADAHQLTFANGAFGLGIGAFGDGFDDCRDRFGEFLAAGGCAITLPTNDAHALPDYVIAQEGLVPRVEALYALLGNGDFPSMVRFDAVAPGKVGLSELMEAIFELADADTIAFVIVAEAAGLVGATLRRSPAAGPVSLELPAVRDWVSFTTERTSDRSLALLVGVAARQPSADAAAFLRPMKAAGQSAPLHAHVHAALFPYRPVQRGELPFGQSISELVGGSPPGTVMHLMADTREFEGVGETDLVRGACWFGALPAISLG
jgi:anti-anti-sigma factor